MLLILRVLVVIIYSVLVCISGCIWCLFSPRNPRHVATFGHLLGRLSSVLGVKVELRKNATAEKCGNAIYIANHQNNYDMVTAAKIVQPTTVTIGKKSLLWVPFFGLLYWLTGNLLIERNNRAKAHGTINEMIKQFKRKKISFWMFPEGTRSRGRGILPFKTGAFHAAITAGVPIIPIVVSNIHNKINLNRWNNGHVIVEMLPPIDVGQLEPMSARTLATHCRELMIEKFAQLNEEVAEREAGNKI